MKLQNKAIVPDTRIYALSEVSKEAGRKRMATLEAAGKITVTLTPMGRRWLTVADAQRLADAL